MPRIDHSSPKKVLLDHLRANATPDFLARHCLLGPRAKVLKRHKKESLQSLLLLHESTPESSRSPPHEADTSAHEDSGGKSVDERRCSSDQQDVGDDEASRLRVVVKQLMQRSLQS